MNKNLTLSIVILVLTQKNLIFINIELIFGENNQIPCYKVKVET